MKCRKAGRKEGRKEGRTDRDGSLKDDTKEGRRKERAQGADAIIYARTNEGPKEGRQGDSTQRRAGKEGRANDTTGWCVWERESA